MPPNLSKLENRPQRKQQASIKEYAHNFTYENVGYSEDIKSGDVLRYEGSLSGVYTYYHYFLCIGKGENGGIEIIEYTGPNSNSGFLSSAKISCSDSGMVAGQIKRSEMFDHDIKQKKVEKVIYPDELNRFSNEDVVARAKLREKEGRYDVLNNNCECFVNWCKFGLNVSLQVKTWFKVLWEVISALTRGLIRFLIDFGIPRIIDKIPDWCPERIKELLIKYFNWADITTVIIVLLELLNAINQIGESYCQYKEGIHVKTGAQLFAKLVEIVATSAGRYFLGNIGSSWGAKLLLQFLGLSGGYWAVIAPLVCGAVGAVIGHLIGRVAGFVAENIAWYIDTVE